MFSETNVISPSALRTNKNPSSANSAHFSSSIIFDSTFILMSFESSSSSSEFSLLISMGISKLFTCGTTRWQKKVELMRWLWNVIKIYLHISSMFRTFKYEMDKRITEALSRWSISSCLTGNDAASSVKISVSRERRQRAASRDFSFRFSLFLKLENFISNLKNF